MITKEEYKQALGLVNEYRLAKKQQRQKIKEQEESLRIEKQREAFVNQINIAQKVLQKLLNEWYKLIGSDPDLHELVIRTKETYYKHTDELKNTAKLFKAAGKAQRCAFASVEQFWIIKEKKVMQNKDEVTPFLQGLDKIF